MTLAEFGRLLQVSERSCIAAMVATIPQARAFGQATAAFSTVKVPPLMKETSDD